LHLNLPARTRTPRSTPRESAGASIAAVYALRRLAGRPRAARSHIMAIVGAGRRLVRWWPKRRAFIVGGAAAWPLAPAIAQRFLSFVAAIARTDRAPTGSQRGRHFRFAPKATVGHQDANPSLSAIRGHMRCSKKGRGEEDKDDNLESP